MGKKVKSAILIFASAVFALSAQKGVEDGSKYGHGEDSIRCLTNLSLSHQYIKQKSFKDAIEPWKIAYNECPASSRNIYIDGEKIFEHKIENASTEEEKQEIVDDLLAMYDKRIKYFGESKTTGEGYVLGKKGTTILEYRGDKEEATIQAHEILKKSIDLQGIRSSPSVIGAFYRNAVVLYRKNLIPGDEIITYYTKISEIFDTWKQNSKMEKLVEALSPVIEELFAVSGAANCDKLIEVYTPKFEANKDNLEELEKINRILTQTADCSDTELFFSVSEAMHNIEPSAESAYGLAKMNLKKENYKKAIENYKEAIDLQKDKDVLAKYYYELATVTKVQNNPELARVYARKAIENRPGWGDPYILIGRLYAENYQSISSDNFEQATVFWAAVDKFQKAKSVDPEAAQMANDLIRSYSKYFPNNEEIFFKTLKEGDPYVVGGWINEKTTVRAR